MNILRGIAGIAFIVIVAGVIAYLGDRVGHQVGRKRLTLYNIRPRYTSTIFAVGTGMLIALIVTLIAIFASNQVKLAFFHLNEINSEILKAQAKYNALEQKVTTAPVVVNLDSLMSPIVGRVPLNAPSGLRHDVVNDFYRQTVAYINRQYARPPYNLKEFSPPANVDRMLTGLADSPEMQARVSQTPVLLFAVADANLYPGDAIHFAITTFPDKLLVPAGQPIASLVVPSGKNVSADLALAELLDTWVPRQLTLAGMPPFYAGNLRVERMLPDLPHMTTMLAGGGATYLMTAFAGEDLYAHTFRFDIVVTLQKAPNP
jgi:hypothetical protein